MIDYFTNGKIYKIVSEKLKLPYIGSTTEIQLKTRLNKHKSNYTEYKKGKRNYVTSFSIIETGDYEITLLEQCYVNTLEELLMCE